MEPGFEPVTDAEARVAVEVKRSLDGLVVSIELTLVSIVQGCALGVLISVAQAPIYTLQWEYWPYLLTSLLHILVFWSRAVAHSLSFISWPLDFTHNFLYVAVTVAEALAIAKATDPEAWFLCNAVFSLLGLVLYQADLVLLRRNQRDFRGDIGRRLYADIERDQLVNVRGYMPAALLFHLVAWLAIRARPELFLAHKWHVALGVYQAVVFGYYLSRVGPLLRRRERLIFQRAVDAAEGQHVVVRKDADGLEIIG